MPEDKRRPIMSATRLTPQDNGIHGLEVGQGRLGQEDEAIDVLPGGGTSSSKFIQNFSVHARKSPFPQLQGTDCDDFL